MYFQYTEEYLLAIYRTVVTVSTMHAKYIIQHTMISVNWGFLIRNLCHLYVQLRFILQFILTSHSRYSDWLQAGRARGRSSGLGRGKIFLFTTLSSPVLGSHPGSYTMGNGDVSPGVK
jgi:hypothetical protein